MEWINTPNPILRPNDLPLATKERLALFAAGKLEHNISQYDQEVMQTTTVEKLLSENQEKLTELMWDPRIWLHYEDVKDDFITFTQIVRFAYPSSYLNR